MRELYGFENASALLPGDIRAAARALPGGLRASAEEFRLRAGAPPSVLTPEGERALVQRLVTVHDLDSLLESATRASAHTALESVAAGFVTVRGGCRVGLCGMVSESEGRVLTIRRLSSAAVRIPREATGCAAAVYPELTEGGFADTLIISPPGAGKTTLLRELVRLLSGEYRVGLLDERGEVAGVWDGVPLFDIGPRTDVLTGADKRHGALMLLRSMNPQILAMDEITARDDLEALRLAAGCGVRLLATAHACDMADMHRRQLYREILDCGVFGRVVTIRRQGPRRVYEVSEVGKCG